MHNAGFLLAAFAIIWAFVFGYVLVLIRRQARLKREIERLSEAPRERNEGRET